MPSYSDQTGRTISIVAHPRRIISLVPSQTELLADLGLEEEVIGITRFCVHPREWFLNKTRVGGTRQLDLELIHRLQPDLIIANKEENTKEQVGELAVRHPVWVSDISTLPAAIAMIRELGNICGREAKAHELADTIERGFASLPTAVVPVPAAYLIWRKPYMTVGGDTFIHDMLRYAGFGNMYADRSRYPETDLQELRNKNPEVLLLSSEPYPFRQKHLEELQQELPGVRILLVDGEMFSWYGSRLRHAPAYVKELSGQVRK